MDCNAKTWCDLNLLGVYGGDEVSEAERFHAPTLFAGGVPGQQHWDIASQVFCKPGLIVVITVEMADV